MGRKKYLKSTESKKIQQTQPTVISTHTLPLSTLTYEQSLRLVELNYENKLHHLSITEPLEIIDSNSTNETEYLSRKCQSQQSQPPPPPTDAIKLPNINIEIDDDEYSDRNRVFKQPAKLIRFSEKSPKELDKCLEYDVDEEDVEWLNKLNAIRRRKALNQISLQQFERIMDCLEKESFFQVNHLNVQNDKQLVKKSKFKYDNELRVHGVGQDEDAICCICLDGECVNSNAILFCDMCNLAVHQECYGVPYIPEGQWLCRKCIQSPSTPVECCLCPNQQNYGAFKQTDQANKWAHMICAIWIPEVHFANTVFLEPIIGIENIEAARWKLFCYICRKRNVGACIQCDKQNCYTAFHVTCAQQAGLYMNIQESGHSHGQCDDDNDEDVEEEEDEQEQDDDADGSESVVGHNKKNTKKKKNKNSKKNRNGNDTTTVIEEEVKKVAYCDIHTPIDALSPRTKARLLQSAGSSLLTETDKREALMRAQKARMKKARKILVENQRNLNSNKSIMNSLQIQPALPSNDILFEKLAKHLASIQKNEKFLQYVINYWLLKRQSRNGVPLIRRLQHVHRKQQQPLPLPLPLASQSQQQQQHHESSLVDTNSKATTVGGGGEGSVTTTATPRTNRHKATTSRGQHTTPHTNLNVNMKLSEQFIYWKRLRQNLEKARLLMELIRKRERVKREQIKLEQVLCRYTLEPLSILLTQCVDKLKQLDQNKKIFSQPVSVHEVPVYYDVIKEPMDLSTMQQKIDSCQYHTFDQFELDFRKIIENCLFFNDKDNYYYKACVKFRDQAEPILKETRDRCNEVGYDRGVHFNPDQQNFQVKQEDEGVKPKKQQKNGKINKEKSNNDENETNLSSCKTTPKQNGNPLTSSQKKIIINRKKTTTTTPLPPHALLSQEEEEDVSSSSSSNDKSRKKRGRRKKIQCNDVIKDDDDYKNEKNVDIDFNKSNNNKTKRFKKTEEGEENVIEKEERNKNKGKINSIQKRQKQKKRNNRDIFSTDSSANKSHSAKNKRSNSIAVSNKSIKKSKALLLTKRKYNKRQFLDEKNIEDTKLVDDHINNTMGNVMETNIESKMDAGTFKRLENSATVSHTSAELENEECDINSNENNNTNLNNINNKAIPNSTSSSSTNSSSANSSVGGVSRRTAVLFKNKRDKLNPKQMLSASDNNKARSSHDLNSFDNDGNGNCLNVNNNVKGSGSGSGGGGGVNKKNTNNSSNMKASHSESDIQKQSEQLEYYDDNFRIYRPGQEFITVRSSSEDTFTDTEESDLDGKKEVNESITGSSVMNSNFLQPLNLVWVKIPFSPWYPGIIINEATIENDLELINIQAHLPDEELLQQKHKNEYLIYIFHNKTPWHCISATKLKQFGINDKKYLNVTRRSHKTNRRIQSSYKKALEVYELLKLDETIEVKKSPSSASLSANTTTSTMIGAAINKFTKKLTGAHEHSDDEDNNKNHDFNC